MNQNKIEDITVILNGFKRPHVIKKQYESIVNQSAKPKEIWFWQNRPDDCILSFDKGVIDNCISFVGNSNLGVWGRFSYALNCKTKYICIFDDDTIPGSLWLRNCLEVNSRQPGLLGTIGVIYKSKQGYKGDYERFGWANPNEDVKQVDIVGHSWFFERELLSYFWRELPDFSEIGRNTVGEDIHFSHMIQKYTSLGTYVPPHPNDNIELWGSRPEIAKEVGADEAAISLSPGGMDRMNESLMRARKNGFKFQFEIERSKTTHSQNHIKIYLSNLKRKVSMKS